MKSANGSPKSARPGLIAKILALSLSVAVTTAVLPTTIWANQDDQGAATEPSYSQQTPEQLQRLVAPIALYPDSLIAQILAAATFPEQVVEADRWVQNHPDLKGDALAQAVDSQPWDPSVKALTAFPSVLGNMDKNLSWTSSLGDAYYNQQDDVMSAIQVMRQKARAAGNLKSTQQQAVTDDEYGDIQIAPVNPEVIYVPMYDPWLVYGYSILPWPGWYEYPGIWFGGPYISFGFGFGIGWFGGFGWGWGHWGFDWHHHYPIFDHHRFYSGSRTFYNRRFYYGARPRISPPPRGTLSQPRPFEGSRPEARGYAQPRGQSGTRSGAFGQYGHGGDSRAYSSRGRSSMGGGGGAPRGGGGAPRGGGGGAHGGGRH